MNKDINLTDEEFVTVVTVLRNVSGDHEESFRKYVKTALSKMQSVDPKLMDRIIHEECEFNMFNPDACNLYPTSDSLKFVEKLVAPEEVVINGVTYVRK